MIELAYEKVGGGYRIRENRVVIHAPELADWTFGGSRFLKLMHFDTGTQLQFKLGYFWDGASGIPDSKRTLPASLAHDGGAQISRAMHWSIKKRKEFVAANNDLFLRLLIEQGMWSWTAKSLLFFLRPLKFYADPSEKRKVFRLP